MKEDNFFLAQIQDKFERCSNKYIVTSTGFMDPHQQSLARSWCKKNFISIYETGELKDYPSTRVEFYGGYEDAERVIMVNLPDYATVEMENPLTVIRASKAPGSKELTHRDYLGSLLSLGLKREAFGDILVREDGADIITLKEMAGFVLTNYVGAGRVNLSVSEFPIEELIVPEKHVTEITDTVASLRLDSYISSAFGLSRGKAQEAITKGIVFVNHVQILKTDFVVKEGDKITLRGKGKSCLKEIGGKSRKDRIYILIEKY